MTSDQIIEALRTVEPKLREELGPKLASLGSRFDVDDLYQVTAMKSHLNSSQCKAESVDELCVWVMDIASNSCDIAIREHA